MNRLISIEYFKLKNTRYFWVLLILFTVFMLAVPVGSKVFIDWLTAQGEEIMNGIVPSELPLFDFVDIWQNLTWVYKSFSIFLGFIAVISISNEFSYGTIKQNIIDGMSRKEFLWSKIGMIVALSAVFSIMAFVIGLIMGLLWSPVKEATFIFKNIEFIGAYFIHLITFQVFCLIVGLLIKRSGITIALLIFYVYIIEPIITSIIRFHYELPWLADLFPVNGIGNIIRIPFPKYILRETQNYVSLLDLGVLGFYLILFTWLVHRMILKRDLG